MAPITIYRVNLTVALAAIYLGYCGAFFALRDGLSAGPLYTFLACGASEGEPGQGSLASSFAAMARYSDAAAAETAATAADEAAAAQAAHAVVARRAQQLLDDLGLGAHIAGLAVGPGASATRGGGKARPRPRRGLHPKFSAAGLLTMASDPGPKGSARERISGADLLQPEDYVFVGPGGERHDIYAHVDHIVRYRATAGALQGLTRALYFAVAVAPPAIVAGAVCDVLGLVGASRTRGMCAPAAASHVCAAPRHTSTVPQPAARAQASPSDVAFAPFWSVVPLRPADNLDSAQRAMTVNVWLRFAIRERIFAHLAKHYGGAAVAPTRAATVGADEAAAQAAAEWEHARLRLDVAVRDKVHSNRVSVASAVVNANNRNRATTSLFALRGTHREMFEDDTAEVLRGALGAVALSSIAARTASSAVLDAHAAGLATRVFGAGTYEGQDSLDGSEPNPAPALPDATAAGAAPPPAYCALFAGEDATACARAARRPAANLLTVSAAASPLCCRGHARPTERDDLLVAFATQLRLTAARELPELLGAAEMVRATLLDRANLTAALLAYLAASDPPPADLGRLPDVASHAAAAAAVEADLRAPLRNFVTAGAALLLLSAGDDSTGSAAARLRRLLEREALGVFAAPPPPAAPAAIALVPLLVHPALPPTSAAPDVHVVGYAAFARVAREAAYWAADELLTTPAAAPPPPPPSPAAPGAARCVDQPTYGALVACLAVAARGPFEELLPALTVEVGAGSVSAALPPVAALHAAGVRRRANADADTDADAAAHPVRVAYLRNGSAEADDGPAADAAHSLLAGLLEVPAAKDPQAAATAPGVTLADFAAPSAFVAFLARNGKATAAAAAAAAAPLFAYETAARAGPMILVVPSRSACAAGQAIQLALGGIAAAAARQPGGALSPSKAAVADVAALCAFAESPAAAGEGAAIVVANAAAASLARPAAGRRRPADRAQASEAALAAFRHLQRRVIHCEHLAKVLMARVPEKKEPAVPASTPLPPVSSQPRPSPAALPDVDWSSLVLVAVVLLAAGALIRGVSKNLCRPASKGKRTL